MRSFLIAALAAVAVAQSGWGSPAEASGFATSVKPSEPTHTLKHEHHHINNHRHYEEKLAKYYAENPENFEHRLEHFEKKHPKWAKNHPDFADHVGEYGNHGWHRKPPVGYHHKPHHHHPHPPHYPGKPTNTVIPYPGPSGPPTYGGR